jgi:hypothetical protein
MLHRPTLWKHYCHTRVTNLCSEVNHAKKVHRRNGSQGRMVLNLTPRTQCTGDLVDVVGERNNRLCWETNPSHPSFTRNTSSHSAASLYVNNHNHLTKARQRGVMSMKLKQYINKKARVTSGSLVHNETRAWRNCERRTPISALITLDTQNVQLKVCT